MNPTSRTLERRGEPLPAARLRAHLLALLAMPSCALFPEHSESTGCFDVADDATSCPDEAEAEGILKEQGPGACEDPVAQVTGPGTLESDLGTDTAGNPVGPMCCYPVVRVDKTPRSDCVVGRPLIVGGEARVARDGTRRPGWAAAEAQPRLDPVSDSLSDGERQHLARFWEQLALEEHASIAAFSRVSIELLNAGADAGLVQQAHQAALDEVRHARLAFALASAYAGEPRGPGELRLGSSLPLRTDLAEIALAAFEEGCVGETASALLAEELVHRATDPAVRATLAVMARDETRHAAFAWRVVQWAMDAGGPGVRRAVRRALDALGPDGEGIQLSIERLVVVRGPDVDPARLAAHGLLAPKLLQEIAARALSEIIRPCGEALLAGGAETGPRAEA